MQTPWTRRRVIGSIPALALAPSAVCASAPGVARADRPDEGARLPTQDPALVAEIVGAAHADLERVRALLARFPELSKASIDWGFGDWESALGAASHTGRREIAQLLIEHGARPDIFTFAMLGHTAAVRAMIEADPALQRTLGPHGISLARHARAGGPQARETLEYLQSLPHADLSQARPPLPAEQRRVYVGIYETPRGQKLEVVDERDTLQVRVDESPLRVLCSAGEHRFHPAGAPSVTFSFTVTGGVASEVRIDAVEPIDRATRR